MNAAAPDFDIDVIDGLEAAEMLGEAFDGKNDVAANGRGRQLQRETGGVHLGLGAASAAVAILKKPQMPSGM